MLATIGFIAAAVLLLIFGGMFIWLVRDSEEPMYNFGLAYIVVAIAFLMWGVLSLINGIGLLIASIVLGDGLLISASMAAVSIVIPHGLKIASYILFCILMFIMLYMRITYYYPSPSFDNGLLIFNTPHAVAVTLSVILALAWLPACLKAARAITTRYNLQRFYALYISTYALPVVCAALFIEARRPAIIIATFVAFCISVLMMVVSNVVAVMNNTGAGDGAE